MIIIIMIIILKCIENNIMIMIIKSCYIDAFYWTHNKCWFPDGNPHPNRLPSMIIKRIKITFGY
jgi:hypothetical protein